MPTKANLKRQDRQDSGKTKVNSPIVFPVLNAQNCTKTQKCLNLLVLSLIPYKCLHFFKIFAVFERILYKQNLQNY
jgi:hypothetical protein